MKAICVRAVFSDTSNASDKFDLKGKNTMMQILKYTILFSVFAAIVCLSSVQNGYAQDPAYNGGSYINQMIRDRMNARRRAAITANRRRSTKKASPAKRGKKAIRRKSRKVSLLENTITPKSSFSEDFS